jgi:hypothetical protein
MIYIQRKVDCFGNLCSTIQNVFLHQNFLHKSKNSVVLVIGRPRIKLEIDYGIIGLASLFVHFKLHIGLQLHMVLQLHPKLRVGCKKSPFHFILSLALFVGHTHEVAIAYL